MVHVSNPGRGKKGFSSLETFRLAVEPPSLLFNGYMGSFQLVKRPVREVNRTPPDSAVMKNKWRHTSVPPILFMARKGEIFTNSSHRVTAAVT